MTHYSNDPQLVADVTDPAELTPEQHGIADGYDRQPMRAYPTGRYPMEYALGYSRGRLRNTFRDLVNAGTAATTQVVHEASFDRPVAR